MSADWSALRGLLIDLDGVVYTGKDPIPGAAELLAIARRQGMKFLLVTNNSTTSPELVAKRLRDETAEVAAELARDRTRRALEEDAGLAERLLRDGTPYRTAEEILDRTDN